jgi:RNA polymerase sigma-32 factor
LPELAEVRGTRRSAPQRAAIDRAFARICKLLAPRFRSLHPPVRPRHHWDDAEQCCAIAVHRAGGELRAREAQFTTFVNWQIRGELPVAPLPLMTDQRPAAQKVRRRRSRSQCRDRADGEESSLESLIEDEDALDRTSAAPATISPAPPRSA